MNVLPETDKAAGAILEAIREVSPEVVEQAVTYYRIYHSVWLVALIPLIGVLVWLMRYCVRTAGVSVAYPTEWRACALFIGFVTLAACACWINTGCDLAKTYYAPDYYAAECMIELGRKALGK